MSRGDPYFLRLKGTLGGVVANLRAKGIHERHLSFGGEGTVPARKPTVPTDARSEFLANRAMGDWAERMLSVAIVRAFPEWLVSQYGDTNRTCGTQVGRATASPTFSAEHRITELGRHDAYVVPQGGGFELDAAATRKVFLAEG